MKRIIGLREILVLFLFSIVLTPPAFSAEKTETIKVYFQPLIGQAPLIIAFEEGFFEAEGLQVEFVKQENAASAFLLLVQGTLDVMLSLPTAGLFNAAKSDGPFKIVSGGSMSLETEFYSGLVVKMSSDSAQGSSEDVLHSLTGQKIAFPILGSVPHYFIDTLFKRSHLVLSEEQIALMPFPLIAASLKKGIIRAGYLAEPFIASFEAANPGNIRTFNLAKVFPNTPMTLLIFGKNIREKKPALAIKFMAAYLKGCRQYQQGKTPRNLEILKKYLNIDESLLRQFVWPTVSPDNIFSCRDFLNGYQDWLLKKKYLAERIDVGKMIDPGFLNGAKKVSGFDKK
jgi:NitT/TauT family transport system substrate-binding protein